MGGSERALLVCTSTSTRAKGGRRVPPTHNRVRVLREGTDRKKRKSLTEVSQCSCLLISVPRIWWTPANWAVNRERRNFQAVALLLVVPSKFSASGWFLPYWSAILRSTSTSTIAPAHRHFTSRFSTPKKARPRERVGPSRSHRVWRGLVGRQNFLPLGPLIHLIKPPQYLLQIFFGNSPYEYDLPTSTNGVGNYVDGWSPNHVQITHPPPSTGRPTRASRGLPWPCQLSRTAGPIHSLGFRCHRAATHGPSYDDDAQSWVATGGARLISPCMLTNNQPACFQKLARHGASAKRLTSLLAAECSDRDH